LFLRGKILFLGATQNDKKRHDYAKIYAKIYAMGTIRKRQGKHGVSYRAEIAVAGVRKSATFDTQSQAMAWIEETEPLLRSGQPLPGELPEGDMDFVSAVEKYTLAVAPGKKQNTRRLDLEIGKRLIAFFSERTLLQVGPKDVAAYRDSRAAKVGPASIIHDMSFISCLYRMARTEWGLQVEDPGKDIRKPSAPRHRLVVLEPRQIDALLDFCCVSKSERLYCYVMLLLHTAMRPSEAAGLRWDQVHDSIIDLTETKTDPRRVPMTLEIKAVLLKMPREGKYVFLREPFSQQVKDQPYRFFRKAFETACREAGLKGFSLYGLRHSAASYLIMNGVDIRTVAEIMGHRNISQTMRYTHFLDAHRIAAIQAIGKLGR
jgi:integrase